MSEPTFGITFTRRDDEPRPVIASDMSVIGIVGTAPDAVADDFPINEPVEVRTNNADQLTALGATGTLPDALRGISDQLGDFQVAARTVVVRVEEGVDDDATTTNLLGSEGGRTGIYALLDAGPELGVIPRLITVPGFTHQHAPSEANPIAAALPGLCSKLLAHAIVEAPGTTDQAAQDWRETMNSERLIPVDLWSRVNVDGSTVTKPGAPRLAGIAARRDYEKRGVPSHSWANQPIQGILGFARSVDFSLTDGATSGQVLLSNNIGIGARGELGVESAISSSGFVFIGTDNASDDPIWQFYNVTRMRDYIHLGLLRTLRIYLGRYNINGQTIQAVVNTMNFWMRDLKSDQHIIDYRVGFEVDKNSPENLRLGKFRVYFEAEEAPVLRRLDIDSMRYRPAFEFLLEDLIARVNDMTL